MAQEQILKVSLKEYKQGIDELRASLLTLNDTDEQYLEIATEITERQRKLNEVMSVGKKNADALDGSYNALVAQMSELKKAWRATADEAERAKLGKQILSINDTLKEMDASIGNFQRNVGNYEGAFTEAFNKILEGVGGTNSKIASGARVIRSLVPLIQQTTKAATTGLEGIRKALATTSIGTLIALLGVVISNWEEIYGWIRKVISGTDEAAESERRHADEMERTAAAAKTTNERIAEQSRLMSAAGASDKAVAQAEIESINEVIKALYDQIQAKRNWIATYGEGTKAQRDEAKRKQEEIDQLKEQVNEYEAQRKKRYNDIRVYDAKEEAQRKATADSIEKAAEDALKGEEQRLRERYDADIKELERYHKDTTARTRQYYKELAEIRRKTASSKTDTQKAEEQELKNIETILKRAEEASKTEIEILDAKYAEEYALLQKYGKDTEALTAEYTSKRLAIIERTEEETMKTEQSLFKADYSRGLSGAESRASMARGRIDAAADTSTVAGEQAYADAVYKIDMELYDEKIRLLTDYLEVFTGTIDEQLALEQQLTELQASQENERVRHKLESDERERESEKAKQQAIMETYNEFSSSVSSVMGSVADLWEQNLQAKVENGEMTEEQARNEFENVKALQYASAVINTAAAAVSSYNSLASIPMVGPVLGAAAAAAAVAAGAVQISTIKNTKFGSAGSTSSTSAYAVPSLTEPDIQEVRNIQTQEDRQSELDALSSIQPVVYVSDIDRAQKRNMVRVEETSW